MEEFAFLSAHQLFSPTTGHDTHSILWRTTHRELKHYTPPRQLLVHLPIRIQSVINTTPLLLIQYNLQQFTPVLLCPNSLPYNLNRVHHIRQDRVMNSSKGSGARTFLGLVRTAAVGTLGPWENAAGREDEHMAVGELLFELTGEALLDFVEAGE